MTEEKKEKFNFKSLLKTIWETFLETIYNFVVIFVIVIFIRTFLISPFHVSGLSMFDTLSNNDYIIVDKLSYYLSTPDFSDIIVFTPPSPRIRQTEGLYCLFTKISKLNFSKETCKMPDFFIKRIIGVPGDKIIIKNGDVYRNGKKLDESKYLTNNNNHHTYVKGTEEEEIFLVPENKYFVLGDNRQGSSDSRAHSQEWYNEQGEYDPFVKKSDIEGRYLFTLIPFSKVQAFISNLK